MADCWHAKGDCRQAIKVLRSVEEKVKYCGNHPELEYRMHNLAGIVLFDLQDYPEALQRFVACRDLATKEQNAENQIKTAQHLGNCFRNLSEMDQAQSQYEYAWELARQHGLDTLAAATLNNLAIFFFAEWPTRAREDAVDAEPRGLVHRGASSSTNQ